MSRIKIFAMVLVSVLLVLLVGHTVFGTVSGTVIINPYTGSTKTIGTKEASYNEDGQVYVSSTKYIFDTCKNLYCVQPGQYLGSELYYTKKSTVIINGDQTKVIDANGNVVFEGTNSYSNRIAAYIYLDTIDVGESTDIDYYGNGGANESMGYGYAWWSLGQLGLWHDWGSWKNAFGDTNDSWVSTYIGGKSGLPNNYYSDEVSYIWYSFTAGTSKMVKMAAENNYSVSFDVLTCTGNQRLILVYPEGIVEPIDIPVTKEWNDGSNRDGKRPTSVTVTLYANGTSTGKSLTLNSTNSWKGTFAGVPKTDSTGNDITYTVKESGMPSGYTASISPTEIVTTTDSEDTTEGFTITNTYIPEKVKFKIVKKWDDDDNRDGLRPSQVTVGFYKEDTKMSTITLKSSNSWTYTTKEYYKYSGGEEISYDFKEVSVDEYTTGTPAIKKLTTEEGVTTYQVTITNTYKPEPIEIPVQKIWNDGDNRDGLRPTSIEVKLFSNKFIVRKLTLNESNGWKGTFTGIYKYYAQGKENSYTINEVTVTGYTSEITGNATSGFTITNTYEPETIEIPVSKIWNDENDLDEYRPDEITVKLYANGADSGKTLTLNESNGWASKFANLYKYEDGKEINYTIKEISIAEYTSEISGDYTSGFTITNTHEPHYDGYIEISGKVWLDRQDGKATEINGILDDDESGLGGIKVTLRDAQGNQFDETSTAVTAEDGTYTIKVNYDNRENVYKLYEDATEVREKLNTSYVEFEYDGIKYTTVSTEQSKAIEDEGRRGEIDEAYSKITASTDQPDKWTNNKITASTEQVISFKNYSDTKTTESKEVLKYCNGDGTYIRTNPDGADKDILKGTNDLACKDGEGHSITTYDIEVQQYLNVNLGLFEREKPDVAIFSELSEVNVIMNNQQYTYLYNVRTTVTEEKAQNAYQEAYQAAIDGGMTVEEAEEHAKQIEIKVKFQNKDTYTYRRPVNPADIAYIQEEANKNAISVLVTYEVKVANMSTKLPITVHNITNYFDTEYTLNTPGWTVTTGDKFNQATYDGDITLEPLSESEAIKLIYTVSIDAIKGLLNEEATLNNAVEIASYSTAYGEKTLYAEQRTGGRTGQPYAGYDYDSHPGNLIPEDRLSINNEGRLAIREQEDDEDIAPSFVLCKEDTPKTLSGTIWEDADDNTEDQERLGNGHYEETEEETEEQVENVKVELYNIDGTLAKLYNEETNDLDRDAIAYTNSDGVYALDGVVTGEYFIKFTYGNDTTKLGHEATTMDGGTTTINARNHKSTIITNSTIRTILGKEYSEFSEEEKMWHITHEDGYSVAVDNMLDRLKIEDLQYSNFEETLNMLAYTKPFKTQIEFEASGQSQVTTTEEELGNREITGNIDVSDTLNKLDFGIAERSREDLFVQKTITNLRLTLANGQVLTEGNPSNGLNFAKAIGFNQNITSGEAARSALEKQLIIEMDAELIQGATLQMQYEVKVTNNNEIDYDYGVAEDYSDIVDGEAEGEYDKFITKSPKAAYYYFGEHSGYEMKSTIEFVDYMDNDVVYTENTEWVAVDIDDLHRTNDELISDDTYEVLEDNQYKVLRSASGEKITLGRGESFKLNMSVNKLLTNSEENAFDNNAEILKIDGKTARTIQESTGGEQVQKSYTPGNYVPSLQNGIFEQDDDRVKVVITPPTGIINYIITYAITGLAGLIVIVVGIVFIKKKVLTK